MEGGGELKFINYLHNKIRLLYKNGTQEESEMSKNFAHGLWMTIDDPLYLIVSFKVINQIFSIYHFFAKLNSI